jgi:hypothetical protein
MELIESFHYKAQYQKITLNNQTLSVDNKIDPSSLKIYRIGQAYIRLCRDYRDKKITKPLK